MKNSEETKSSGFLPCFECGNTSDHDHHVIPKVYGGSKTIRLCERCHGKVHDRKFTNHKEMTKKGLAAAKARGTKLGTTGHEHGKKLAAANISAANQFAANLKSAVHSALSRGLTRAEIAAEFNRTGIPTARPGSSWHSTSVQNLIKRQAAM
jgi:hypothetical protein